MGAAFSPPVPATRQEGFTGFSPRPICRRIA